MIGDEEERLQFLKGSAGENAEALLPIIYLALSDQSWRLRKEAVGLFLSLPRAGEMAGEIINLLYAQDNAGLRNASVEILVSLGRQAVSSLLAELRCEDHDVRKFVLDILGEIRDPAATGPMVKALDDADKNVRAAAAENLGKIGSATAVPALLDTLRHSDLLFRFTVLQALGQIGASVPLDRLLEFKDEPLLRPALFDCLGRVGGSAALPVLTEGLTDRMRNVREAAVSALIRLGETRTPELATGLTLLAGGREAEAIAEFLVSGRVGMQKAAVHLLGWIRDGRFARQLLELLENPDLRETAIASLLAVGTASPGSLMALWPEASNQQQTYLAYLFGETQCEGSYPLLQEGLASSDVELRAMSARALARLGTAASLPVLVQALTDTADEVREGAMHALVELSKCFRTEILHLLQPLLETQDPEIRMYAVLVLGSLDGEEVENSLTLAMKDESPLVRQAAVRAFDGHLGRGQVPILMLALTDEDHEVRRLAAELLGTLGDPLALRPLAMALQDEDIWVRATAVRALGNLASSESEELIKSALRDPVGLVVIAALETLAARDLENFSPCLNSGLSHPDAEVVSAVLQLLAVSGRRDWIDPVRDNLLNHRHWEVRTSFARILAQHYGSQCRPWLEARLLVEVEDLVRQQVQELLAALPAGEG